MIKHPGVVALFAPLLALAVAAEESKSKLPEEPIPLQTVPSRPKPLLELGEPFLGSGTLAKGFTLKTGATWQPSFLLWGRMRSALFVVEDREESHTSEWGNRLDVFAQLSLTSTERVVFSVRPLDESSEFTGYVFSPDDGHGGQTMFDSTIDTFYFEGDLSELFPNLDPTDSKALDFGFSVGRQPLFFQDGMLIADSIDSVGVVRNAIYFPGFNSFRITGLFGWGNVNRGGNNTIDPGARVVGIFTEGDTSVYTIAADLVYVRSDATSGDGVFAGLSAVRRFGGRVNATLRGLASRALGDETPTTGSGVLLTSELSLTPHATRDIAYFNAFASLGSYTPAARAARLGGPLGRMGILFEGSGIGAYGAVLSNRSEDVWGLVGGYQKFFNAERGQIIFEIGSRAETRDGDVEPQVAFGTRFQHAMGRRLVVRLEGFAVGRESSKPRYGARTEIMLAF